MKTIIEKCLYCGHETLIDTGKKMATTRTKAYTRRYTKRCRNCGTREIKNIKMGVRIVKGKNQSPEK